MSCGLAFLKEICPANIDLEKYFVVENEIKSINDINAHMCSSLQNRNRMARIINFKKNRPIFSDILFGFEPKSILNNYNENNLFSVFKERFNIKNADGFQNIWYRYAKYILSGCNFLNQFENINQFNNFIEYFLKDKLTRAALPLLLAQEIDGLGFVLACDFLKELGYIEYPKPDVHLKDIFAAFNLCAKNKYDVYKAIIRMAEACNVTPYRVDKVFWLICSGNYYLDNINIRGRKKELISR